MAKRKVDVKRSCTYGRTIANHLFDADGGAKIMIASLRHEDSFVKIGGPGIF